MECLNAINLLRSRLNNTFDLCTRKIFFSFLKFNRLHEFEYCIILFLVLQNFNTLFDKNNDRILKHCLSLESKLCNFFILNNKAAVFMSLISLHFLPSICLPCRFFFKRYGHSFLTIAICPFMHFYTRFKASFVMHYLSHNIIFILL